MANPYDDRERSLPPAQLRSTRAEPFLVRQEQRGALPLLRVQGAIDMAAGPRLRDALLAALSRGTPSLAIDLSQVSLLDSTGAGVLRTASERTAARGGVAYLIGVRGHVLRALQLLGLDKEFRLCGEADLPSSFSTQARG